VGVTSDLTRRVWQHHSGQVEGFTQDYGVRSGATFTISWHC